MREHTQCKNKWNQRTSVSRKCEDSTMLSVYCTSSLAFIHPLEMCNWHSVISLVSLENDIVRETAH